jgi:hypothetical protein
MRSEPLLAGLEGQIDRPCACKLAEASSGTPRSLRHGFWQIDIGKIAVVFDSKLLFGSVQARRQGYAPTSRAGSSTPTTHCCRAAPSRARATPCRRVQASASLAEKLASSSRSMASRSRSPPRLDRSPPRHRSRSPPRGRSPRRGPSRSPTRGKIGDGTGERVTGTACRWNDRGFGFIKPARFTASCIQRGCSSVAERPLCMRKAQGSNPCSSTNTHPTPWRNG